MKRVIRQWYRFFRISSSILGISTEMAKICLTIYKCAVCILEPKLYVAK